MTVIAQTLTAESLWHTHVNVQRGKHAFQSVANHSITRRIVPCSHNSIAPTVTSLSESQTALSVTSSKQVKDLATGGPLYETAADLRPAVTDEIPEVTASKRSKPSTMDSQQRLEAASTTSPSTSYHRQPVGVSSRSRTSRNPTNVNQQLIDALLTVALKQLASEGTSAWRTMTDVVEKGSRWMSGLPPGFPPGPQGESVGAFLADPLQFLKDCRAKYGGIVGLLLGGEYVVLLSEAAAARQVLIEQAGSVFVKEGTAFFPGSSLAGEGLLVSDGEVWRRQRQLANPAFRKAAVERYAQAMQQAATALADDAWATGGVRDVYSDFNALTLRVTMDALFGVDLPESLLTEITGSIQTAFEYFAGRAATGFIIPEWFPTPDNLQYNLAVSRLNRVVYRVIAERKQALSGLEPLPEQAEGSLLDGLLQSRDESGAGMTERALRDELMTLLVAGQETSAILLAWTCARLAHHPAVQAAVREEVAAVLQGARPNASNVRDLHLLQGVVLETLRLHPPAYLVGRCASQPVSLAAFHLPAGSTVLVSPYLMHRDPQAWHNPEAFDISRWEGLGGASSAGFMATLTGMGPNGSYLPFGAGPRNCIGTGFAMTEALIVLAVLLQRVSLAEAGGSNRGLPRPDPRITLRPSSTQLLISPL